MAEAYPANVPDLVIAGSYTHTPVNSVLRFHSDIGKPMTRNKFTGQLYNATWQIRMTATEFQALMAWYLTTLNRVLPFDFPEPTSGTLREYTFITPPSINHEGVDQYIVTFTVRSIVGYN